MYQIKQTTKFKKQIKKHQSDKEIIVKILNILQNFGAEGLPLAFKPHKLKGNFNGFWECHIKPDLLLVWNQSDESKTIYLLLIGSHAQLFN